MTRRTTEHGTFGMYKGGCKCDVCVAFMRAYWHTRNLADQEKRRRRWLTPEYRERERRYKQILRARNAAALADGEQQVCPGCGQWRVLVPRRDFCVGCVEELIACKRPAYPVPDAGPGTDTETTHEADDQGQVAGTDGGWLSRGARALTGADRSGDRPLEAAKWVAG